MRKYEGAMKKPQFSWTEIRSSKIVEIPRVSLKR